MELKNSERLKFTLEAALQLATGDAKIADDVSTAPELDVVFTK